MHQKCHLRLLKKRSQIMFMDREDILNLYVTYNIPLPEKALPRLDALPDEIPF